MKNILACTSLSQTAADNGGAMFNFINLVRALGDESRARILMALRHRPLCVCEITTLLGLAASTTSKHLFLLRQARLIESVKKGRWVYYRLPENPLPGVRDALTWVEKELADTPQILQDAAALPGIFHNKNIHAFLERKHIPAAACDPQDADNRHSGRKNHV